MKTRLAAFLLAVVVALAVMTRPPAEREARAQSGGGTTPLVNAWNVGSVTSGSAVLGANFKPLSAASVLRITAVLGSTAPLSVFVTDGTHTFTVPLNGGTALTAGCAFTFTIGCRLSTAPGGVAGGPTGYNFVVGGTTTVPILWCDEVVGAVD